MFSGESRYLRSRRNVTLLDEISRTEPEWTDCLVLGLEVIMRLVHNGRLLKAVFAEKQDFLHGPKPQSRIFASHCKRCTNEQNSAAAMGAG